MSREYTNRLLEMVDEGLLDARQALLMCVKYMSEDEVADMIRFNDLSEQLLGEGFTDE
jgi:hypothetical protein